MKQCVSETRICMTKWNLKLYSEKESLVFYCQEERKKSIAEDLNLLIANKVKWYMTLSVRRQWHSAHILEFKLKGSESSFISWLD